MENVTDLMMDIETLGVKPGCAVLAIGATAFDPRKPWTALGQEISIRHRFVNTVSLEDCLRLGLRIEAGSMRFWMRQPREAQDEAFSGTDTLAKAGTEFIRWFYGLPAGGRPINVWAHGASFDPGILAHALEAAGLDAPWEFRSIRDTRTAFDMGAVVYRGTHHTVIQDCLQQCEHVCEAFGKLGLIRALDAG